MFSTYSSNGVVINGGRNIVIRNGKVIVDGKDVTPENEKVITIKVHGTVEKSMLTCVRKLLSPALLVR
jgi:hypothetical protein